MPVWEDMFVEFYINNYNNINSLKEIIVIVEAQLPSLLDKEIDNALNEIDFEPEIQRELIGDEFCWFDPNLYESDEDKGVYCGISSSWKSIFEGNDPADASYLYLYVGTGELKQQSKRKEMVTPPANQIKKERSRFLQKKIIVVNPIDYDDPYLLKYPLHREVNMEALGNRENMNKALQRAIKNFTDVTLSVLKNKKKK